MIVEEYNDLLEQLHGSFSELHDSVKKMAESERSVVKILIDMTSS